VRDPNSIAAAQGTGAWLQSPWPSATENSPGSSSTGGRTGGSTGSSSNSANDHASDVPSLLLTPEQEASVAAAFKEVGFRFERLIVPPVVNQEKNTRSRLLTLNPECTSAHT